VAQRLHLVRFLPGDVIIRQGEEEAFDFFIVDSGRCSAHVQDAEGLREVREYSPGSERS
ncbi:rbcL, partial [Symbiodinium pilosum]